eukprot:CAMPEP_0205858616 /NCGR_PEP_ID=MMETSP1083-20121108/4296_1 /ASSEMBLY_ACC=CAM_ASM_000430 /TAXON_ID=97485 /ORGANISM="Prymnesium parvum, Strain Texoma1" /LENGTH=68 /DNA_ID=CAMNT_0053220195 /DNA_START=279 /DNA_END=482 /DNA_ORIENTATION=-
MAISSISLLYGSSERTVADSLRGGGVTRCSSRARWWRLHQRHSDCSLRSAIVNGAGGRAVDLWADMAN